MGEEGTDEVFDASEDLVEGEAGGVDDDGVGSGLQRRVGAIAVALIALTEFLKNGSMAGAGLGSEGIVVARAGILLVAGVRQAVLHAGVLFVTALAARFGRSIEKNFNVGVGKDDGADIAAFHHNAAWAAEVTLEVDHPGANVGMDADSGGTLGDVGVANALSDVGAVEIDAIAGAVGHESDVGVIGEEFEGLGVIEVVIGLDGLEREGAVHRSGFEIEQAEVLSEMARYRALAGAGGAVDGDDGAADHSGFSS